MPFTAIRGARLMELVEQQSSTLVLHSAGHSLKNVEQDMGNWSEAFQESEPIVRTPETEVFFLRSFAITEDDSQSRCNTDPPYTEK